MFCVLMSLNLNRFTALSAGEYFDFYTDSLS